MEISDQAPERYLAVQVDDGRVSPVGRRYIHELEHQPGDHEDRDEHESRSTEPPAQGKTHGTLGYRPWPEVQQEIAVMATSAIWIPGSGRRRWVFPWAVLWLLIQTIGFSVVDPSGSALLFGVNRRCQRNTANITTMDYERTIKGRRGRRNRQRSD
jgi:hypothetical protein